MRRIKTIIPNLHSSLEKSPTQRLVDAGKTFRNFFSADKRNSKRKRSTAASKSESMDSNGGDGMQDVTVAFETAFSQSANDRDQYGKDRTNLLHTEAAKSWDHQARESASDAEKRAANIILKIREDERENLFGDKASEAIPGPETLDMGGQFLTNKDRIEESRLFAISQRLPKGAHLHIHFNSEFPPDKLLTKAKVFVPDTMFIRSTQPILNTDDLKATEMVFNVLPKETPSADIFSKSYKPEFKNTANNPWMKWTTFTADLKKNYGLDAEDWVQTKMILGEDEVYAIRQTTNGIWARFNQGTRCFKGLMNYESVYRWYISEVIESMIEEHVMYTELRPMLMDKSIPSDDGKTQISNSQQMKIILEEWEKKKAQLKSQDRLDAFPFGLKIIYCTPRSIPKPKMKSELQDCIKLKLEFPDLICGMDYPCARPLV